MAHRLLPDTLAAGQRPPGRDKRDPAQRRTGERRKAEDKQQPGEGAKPPAVGIKPAIKHATSCQEFAREPIVLTRPLLLQAM